MLPGRKHKRCTVRGPDLKTILNTGRALSTADALALLDQVIFNILAANTAPLARTDSLAFPSGAGSRLPPGAALQCLNGC